MVKKIEIITECNATNKTNISGRELPQLIWIFFSIKSITGNNAHLRTRDNFKAIEDRLSWDSKFNLSANQKTINEKQHLGKSSI